LWFGQSILKTFYSSDLTPREFTLHTQAMTLIAACYIHGRASDPWPRVGSWRALLQTALLGRRSPLQGVVPPGRGGRRRGCRPPRTAARCPLTVQVVQRSTTCGLDVGTQGACVTGGSHEPVLSGQMSGGALLEAKMCCAVNGGLGTVPCSTPAHPSPNDLSLTTSQWPLTRGAHFYATGRSSTLCSRR
jgi:hypothetical protein